MNCLDLARYQTSEIFVPVFWQVAEMHARAILVAHWPAMLTVIGHLLVLPGNGWKIMKRLISTIWFICYDMIYIIWYHMGHIICDILILNYYKVGVLDVLMKTNRVPIREYPSSQNGLTTKLRNARNTILMNAKFMLSGRKFDDKILNLYMK